MPGIEPAKGRSAEPGGCPATGIRLSASRQIIDRLGYRRMLPAMKKIVSLLAFSACWNAAVAAPPVPREPNSVIISLPHPAVDPAPTVTVTEALKIGLAFAAKKRPDISQFYVDRVWLEYDSAGRRMWAISFANPKLLYFFVSVHMNGRASLPPKSGIISKNPFIEWNYAPPARRPR